MELLNDLIALWQGNFVIIRMKMGRFSKPLGPKRILVHEMRLLMTERATKKKKKLKVIRKVPVRDEKKNMSIKKRNVKYGFSYKRRKKRRKKG